MTVRLSRAEFFQQNPRASAWAALNKATMQSVRPNGWIRLPQDSLKGKEVVILGSGVAGLTAAYEILAHGSGAKKVTILEAQNRTGGRCLTLRTGDALSMVDKDADLWDASPANTQVVRFERPLGDSEPYLNAGPGRIPSSHKHLLSYLKDFGVQLEIYVMNSGANLVAMQDGPLRDGPHTYRRLDHNTRGWLSQWVYCNAARWVSERLPDATAEVRKVWRERLEKLMISFGDLDREGRYLEDSGQAGLENARSRAGYDELPGVAPGEVPPSLSPEDLLESEFWSQTRFYQPQDFLWQQTLFQPVGGMDHVQRSFAQQVAALGGEIRLNSPVQSVDWNDDTKRFQIEVAKIGTDEVEVICADHCLSNIPLPFLQRILSDKLQGKFEGRFRMALDAVYDGQQVGKTNKQGFKQHFLANTTKVGWQADRHLWQGITFDVKEGGAYGTVACVHGSEVGVVPIFGGISWTSHEITQIWYPSTAYHDKKGVLTGAYNFGEEAFKAGELTIEKRFDSAYEGAKLFGDEFANGLDRERGVAIAWQHVPYIRGGWAQWHVLDNAPEHFHAIACGTTVDGDREGPKLLVIGDQISSLPGWQEGAITSSLNAISRLANWDVEPFELTALPDTRLMVEGL